MHSEDSEVKTKVKKEPVDRRVKIEDVDDEELQYPPIPTVKFEESDQESKDDDDGDGNFDGGASFDFGLHGAADFDDEENIDRMLNDLDTKGHIEVHPKKEPSPPFPLNPQTAPPPKEEEIDTPWSSTQQLITFRNNASAIADVSEKHV